MWNFDSDVRRNVVSHTPSPKSGRKHFCWKIDEVISQEVEVKDKKQEIEDIDIVEATSRDDTLIEFAE